MIDGLQKPKRKVYGTEDANQAVDERPTSDTEQFTAQKCVGLDLELDGRAQDAFLRLAKALPRMGEELAALGSSLMDLGCDFVPDALLKNADDMSTIATVLSDLRLLESQIHDHQTKKRFQVAIVKVSNLGKPPLFKGGFADPQTDHGREETGIFLRMPERIASQWPNNGQDNSPTHATLLNVGPVTPDEFHKVIDQVRSVCMTTEPFDVHVTDYGEFQNPKGQTIPHMIPRGDGQSLESLHGRLRKEVTSVLGRDVKHIAGPFKPHITLDYVDPGKVYKGPRPQGSFKADAIEVWGQPGGSLGRHVIQVGTGDVIHRYPAEDTNAPGAKPVLPQPTKQTLVDEKDVNETGAHPGQPGIKVPLVGKAVADTTVPAKYEAIDPANAAKTSAALQGINARELAAGIQHEGFTTSDPLTAARQAVENLRGNPKYYTDLQTNLLNGHPLERATELSREKSADTRIGPGYYGGGASGTVPGVPPHRDDPIAQMPQPANTPFETAQGLKGPEPRDDKDDKKKTVGGPLGGSRGDLGDDGAAEKPPVPAAAAPGAGVSPVKPTPQKPVASPDAQPAPPPSQGNGQNPQEPNSQPAKSPPPGQGKQPTTGTGSFKPPQTNNAHIPASAGGEKPKKPAVKPPPTKAEDENAPPNAAGLSSSKRIADPQTLTVKFIRKADDPKFLDSMDEQRTVFGIVLEPETVDAQRDIYSADEIEKTAERFLEQYQQFGLMHQSILPSILPLQSYIAPVDFTLNGQEIKKGTWLLKVRVLDDGVWGDVKSGRLTGFSIGGSAVRKPEESVGLA